MKRLVIDIETIACQQPGILEEIRATVTPPGNISKPETIAKWIQENADKAANDEFRKTSFNGAKGEICCIGWAVDDEPVQSLCRGVGESEESLLLHFFALTGGYDYQIIGHNSIAFDIRFLYQRCVINSVQPTFNIRQEERYNGRKVFDTMTYFAGWGNRISLANLCAALGIQVKTGDITGATVYDAWLAGRISEIADCCREDVTATREVYKRLTFGEDLWPEERR